MASRVSCPTHELFVSDLLTARKNSYALFSFRFWQREKEGALSSGEKIVWTEATSPVRCRNPVHLVVEELAAHLHLSGRARPCGTCAQRAHP